MVNTFNSAEAIEQIAEAVIQLLASREKIVRFGENGYRLVTDNFNISNVVNKYSNLYMQSTKLR